MVISKNCPEYFDWPSIIVIITFNHYELRLHKKSCVCWLIGYAHFPMVTFCFQAKADTIESLERYRGKCEPCFLFYAVSSFLVLLRSFEMQVDDL
jgi:hypothetical protein